MKTFILLVGISLTLASPPLFKIGKPTHENEFVIHPVGRPDIDNTVDNLLYNPVVRPDIVDHSFYNPVDKIDKPALEKEFDLPEKQYPEIITEDAVDYSQLPMEQLLQVASEHEGLEFLKDANLTAAMGFDISSIPRSILEDALATTVSHIFINIFPLMKF